MGLPLQSIADIRLWSTGVEVGIFGLISVLHDDNFILSLRYRLVSLKIIRSVCFALGPLAKDMDGASFGGLAVIAVAMYGDEEVGIVVPGNHGSLVKSDEFICRTCIYYLDIRIGLFDLLTQEL